MRTYAQSVWRLPLILIASTDLGVCRNRGIAMLPLREHRDEDIIEASAQGACFVFTTARRTIGKGRAIPQAGSPWPCPSGVG